MHKVGLNMDKTITIKRWILVMAVFAVSLTIGSMGGMLINDRYVVLNKADMNASNITDLTSAMDKLLTKVEIHVTSGGHEVMGQRMKTMETEFKEMRSDIKEILRRTR